VFEETFPTPTDPGSGGGGGTTPPPTPSQPPVWTPDAAVHGRTALFGAFPSDLVRFGDTLFVTDADAVETTGARILAYDIAGATPQVSSRFASTTIRASDLRDSAGQAGDAAAPIGFGYFLGDLTIVSPSLGFVLANAGGSDSTPTLSNLIVFDPTRGTIRQVVDLANAYAIAGLTFDSSGNAIQDAAYTQSGAEALCYIDNGNGSGRLYVAMSNLLFAAPSNGATKLPGTIQVLDVAPASPTPVTFAGNGAGGSFVIRTQAFNPVAIDDIAVPPAAPGLPARSRLLVTCAGTTDYDSAFNLVPTTVSTVEAYDASSGAFEGRFDLGLAGLAAVRPALGYDGAGHFVGFYPSSVTGELYLLRLDGLLADPINPNTLAVLRGPFNGIPVTAAERGGPGGNLTGVALSPDGRTLAVTGFGDLFAFPTAIPGQLFLMALPADLVTGSSFGVDFVPGATRFAATPGRTLGGVVLAPGDGARPDVYVNVSGTLDASFLGNGSASLGSLQTHGLIR
ncbi:MAG: hypothetical protein P1V36_16040, partial [Planctomycetota bacterium]|nr:hypothetical protein [Planctomycetota bacterium]